MKKRSLFAAVAMLIVSAIVLTSTTYAWFTLSNNAEVTTITASVDKSSGLSLSANSTGTKSWKSTLSSDDILKGNAINGVTVGTTTTYSWPVNIIPVDYSPNSETIWTKATAGTAADTITTSEATANTDYYSFTIYLKGTPGATVNFAQGTGDTQKSTFTGSNTSVQSVGYVNFSYIEDPTVQSPSPSSHIYSASGSSDQYSPLNSVKTTAVPIVSGIVQESSHLNTAVSTTDSTQGAPALSAQSLILNSSGEATITIYMWIEGQDSHCVSTNFAAGDLTLNLKFKQVEPTP